MPSVGALQQSLHLDLPRPDAVQRRQPAQQHEIQARVSHRLLDHQLICRRLDDAQLLRVALRIGARLANFQLGQRVAACAVADSLHRSQQRLAQPHCRLAIVLQQMERDALRRAWPDARQMPQRIDQLIERRTELHDFEAGVRDPSGRTCTRFARKCAAGFGRPGARREINCELLTPHRGGAVNLRKATSCRAAAACQP